MGNKIKSLLYIPMTALIVGQSVIAQAGPDGIHTSGPVYTVTASNPVLVRRVTGPVSNSINGVIAEPVDSFDWAGQNVTPIKGEAKLKIDPEANTGSIKASWVDENGEWEYTQTMFVAPPHPTGVRFGSATGSTTIIQDDPVTTNVYLHGDTGAGAPVVPTLFNFITTWGPAKITLNGQPFENPLDGPVPLWAGHTMTSERVRNADGTVRTVSGDIYNMMKKSEGAVIPDSLDFHLVFHDAPGPDMTDNVPPPLGFFYHLSFSKVKISIKQKR